MKVNNIPDMSRDSQRARKIKHTDGEVFRMIFEKEVRKIDNQKGTMAGGDRLPQQK